jgi:phosphoribosylaminoimidazole-succinocarboxamide synthase
VVKPVEIIPLEVVLRNIAAGSLCRQTPIRQGTSIDPALLDLYYKDDALGDPLLTEARVRQLGVVDEARLSAIEDLARRVNAVLVPFFAGIDLQLVDFKLEFGLGRDGDLLLADEISPDTCRLWDSRIEDCEDRIMDKDRFRQDLGGVMDAYGEVFKRVQGACPNPGNCL